MLFKPQEFESENIQKIIKKANRYESKEKTSKMITTLSSLDGLLKDDQSKECEEAVYILSVLHEDYPNLISKKVEDALDNLVRSENDIIRLNAIIIYGTLFLNKMNDTDEVLGDSLDDFIDLGLKDEVEEITGNIIFFIERFPDDYLYYIIPRIEELLNFVDSSQHLEVVDALLVILGKIWEESLDIKLTIFERLFHIYMKEESDEKRQKIIEFLAKGNQNLAEFLEKNEKYSDEALQKVYNNRLPAVKIYDIKKVAKDEGMSPKDVEKQFLKIKGDDRIFRFPYQDKKKYYVEIEIKPLLRILENDKVEVEELIPIFGNQQLDTINLLNLLIKKLVKGKLIKGYLSKSYFYSYNYIKEMLMSDIRQEGEVDLDNHAKHINHNFIVSIAEDINRETKFTGIFTKNKSHFMTLSKVMKNIERDCVKNSIYNLSEFKHQFTYEDYHTIEKECASKFFTEYHIEDAWLTNIGYTRLTNQFRKGQIVGFIDIQDISEKSGIPMDLVKQVLQSWLEAKPGMWDNNNEKYYFTKYIKSEIGDVNQYSSESERKAQLVNLSAKMNVTVNDLEDKLTQERKELIENIKKRPSINIQTYTKSLGMERREFIDMINKMNVEYLLQENTMLFDPKRISKRKEIVKSNIIKKSHQREELYISELSKEERISEHIVTQLLKSAHNNKSKDRDAIHGIFINEDFFLTERGVERRIMQDTDYITTETIIDERKLNQKEEEYVVSMLERQISQGKLTGTYDENAKEFHSDDMEEIRRYEKSKKDAKGLLDLYVGYMAYSYNKLRDLYLHNDNLRPGDLKRQDYLISRVTEHFQNWEHNLRNAAKKVTTSLDNIEDIEDLSFGDIFDQEAEKKEEVDEEALISYFTSWKEKILKLEQVAPRIGLLKKKILKADDPEKLNKELEEIYAEVGFIKLEDPKSDEKEDDEDN